MKNLKIFLLLALIFLTLEKKISGKKRKLEESDSTFENIDDFYDSTTYEKFQSDVEIDQGNSTSSDTHIISSDIPTEEMSTSIESNTNNSEEDNSIIIENNTKTDIFEEKKTNFIENNTNTGILDNKSDIVNNTDILDEVDSSNKVNHTEISDSININSTIIGNNTEIDNDPNHNIPTYSSKLILLGFGHYFRPIQKEFIYFIVYFFRILGNIPSSYLIIPINIDYSNRLGFLEENKAYCTRITDDFDDNIQYNCSAPVDPNKTISSLNITGNDLSFGNDENVNCIFSSNANHTKSNLLNQTGNDLDKGIIVIKDTILEKNDEKFLIIGNSSEIITDSKIILYLDNNGNIINIDCNSTNLLGKLYKFECIPNKSINNHLNGISGKTDSGQNLVIYFEDGKDDFVNFNNNNSSQFDNIDYNFEKTKASSSSSGLSSGAIAGIVIGGVVFLIAMITLISCCCRKADVKAPFEESTVKQPLPKDTTTQSI